MKEYLNKIVAREDLTHNEAVAAMTFIMEGKATDTQIAAFLVGLKLKQESPAELLGFVEVMREKAVKIHIEDPEAIDMCGTGGDGSGTFNISTAASLVVAGTGVTVAKHGNRSISSSCGSADVLRALGVNIDLPPSQVEACINTVGIGFLFAPLFHPSMKYAAKTRSELGIKTFFNMLGPLTNPAGVTRQLVGAFNRDAALLIISVFEQLQPHHVCVVSSHDGLDEISLSAATEVWEVRNGMERTNTTLHPSSLGFHSSSTAELLGGDAIRNAQIVLQVLKGVPGPQRDIVLANAAMGIYVSGKSPSLTEGIRLAEESIDSGKALTKLNDLIAFTNR